MTSARRRDEDQGAFRLESREGVQVGVPLMEVIVPLGDPSCCRSGVSSWHSGRRR